MKPEHRMLAWEQWRQTRAYLVLPLFVVLVGIGTRLASLSEGLAKASDLQQLADSYVLGTLVLAACVFCLHFDRRLTLQLGVPQRTFRLPVSSTTLTAVQLGFRLAIVLVIFVACLLLHRLLIGPGTELVFGPTLAFLLGFYALALGTVSFIQPYSLGVKTKMLTPLLIFAAVVAYPCWIAATATPWLFALATIVPGGALAVAGHHLARHGGLQWRFAARAAGSSAVRYRSVADIPRFDSPAEAQHWLEMRRFFWMMPAVAALCWVGVLSLYVGGAWSRITVHPFQSPGNSPALFFSLLIPAALLGIVLTYKDYKLPDTALGRFVFTRPAAPALLARARVLMTAKAVGATLVLSLLATFVGWLLVATYEYPFHFPFRRVQDPLSYVVQGATEWMFFVALVFGLVFAFSRSGLYLVVLLGPVALLVWGLAGGFVDVDQDLLLVGDIATLLALLAVTGIALATKVHHPRLLHGVLGGTLATFLLVVLYGVSEQAPLNFTTHAGAYMSSRAVLPGFGVLLALMAYSTVALAMHRRRSRSLVAPAMERGEQYLCSRRRILAGWLGAILVVAALHSVYFARTKAVETRMLGRHLWGATDPGMRVPRDGHADALAPHLASKQDVWRLDESDWRKVQEAHPYRALDFSHRDLQRFQPIIHLPQLPAPGIPLSEDDLRDSDFENAALREKVDALLGDLQDRAPLTLDEAARHHFSQYPNVDLERFVAREVWHWADEGRMEAAWERFLALLDHNVAYNAVPSMEAQTTRYTRSRMMAMTLGHLLLSAPPVAADLEAVIARLPEDYDYPTMALPMIAATVKHYALFDGRRSPRWLRPDEATGGHTLVRQPLYGQLLDHMLYAGTGLKNYDRFYYLLTAYTRMSRKADELPPTQWHHYVAGNAPVSGLITAQLSNVYRAALMGQISEQLMRTAAAVALHERNTGRLPPNLTALAPEYLPDLPADPLADRREAVEGRVESTLGSRDAVDYRGEKAPIPTFRYRLISEEEAVVSIVDHRGAADPDQRMSEPGPVLVPVFWIRAWDTTAE